MIVLGRRKRRLNFRDALPSRSDVNVPLQADDTVICWTLLLPFSDGSTTLWDFSRYPRMQLALDVRRAFEILIAHGLLSGNKSTRLGYKNEWGQLLSHIDQFDPSGRIQQLSDLDAEFLEGQDRIGMTIGGWGRLCRLVKVLRGVRRVAPDMLSSTFLPDPFEHDRLAFISRYPKPVGRKRDSYTPYVAKQINNAAMAECKACHHRILTTRKNLNGVPRDGSPVRDLYDRLRLYIAEHGPVSTSVANQIGRPSRDTRYQYAPTLTTLGIEQFITPNEATSFLVILALRCNIPYDSIKTLDRNCLRNARSGFVDIVYTKSRGPIVQVKTERVRDGGIETPGGIVRAILDLTAPASRLLSQVGHARAGSLWLVYHPRRNVLGHYGFWHPTQHPWYRFAERHVILDDTGARLESIEPSRFRKTVKEQKYRKAGGHLSVIADDHTPAVSARHYADIPALSNDHDQAVENAQKALLAEISSGGIVVNTVEDDNVSVAALAGVSGKDGVFCAEVLKGDHDVWLAGCLGFKASPYAPAGSPCTVSFTECLHCPNAVITKRKLPNILRFRAFLLDQRAATEVSAWEATGARDLARIEVDILSRFTSKDIREAEAAIATATDGDEALFLPLPVREGGSH